MKKQIIKIISMALVLVIISLAITSCSWFKNRHCNNGFSRGGPMNRTEYYWVETYEEALQAISEFESYGSTIMESVIYEYNGDLFDTKYCFELSGSKDSVKWGKKPSERWVEKVYVRAYAFFEDVSIEEFEYSYVSSYDVAYLSPTNYFLAYHKEGDNIDKDSLTFSWFYNNSMASIKQEDVTLFNLDRSKGTEPVTNTDECVEVIINSLVFVGKDDPYYDTYFDRP